MSRAVVFGQASYLHVFSVLFALAEKGVAYRLQPAESMYSTGIEVAVEAEKMATEVIRKYPRALFVAGQLIFAEDTFVTRLLHNETAFMVQRRLQHSGLPMVVLPVRLNLDEGPRIAAPSMTVERVG